MRAQAFAGRPQIRPPDTCTVVRCPNNSPPRGTRRSLGRPRDSAEHGKRCPAVRPCPRCAASTHAPPPHAPRRGGAGCSACPPFAAAHPRLLSRAAELACVYAAIVLHDDGLEVSGARRPDARFSPPRAALGCATCAQPPSNRVARARSPPFLSAHHLNWRRPPARAADNISALVKAAGVEVEPYWPSLFAKLVQGKDIGEMLASIGSAGAARPHAPPPGARCALQRRHLCWPAPCWARGPDRPC